MTGKDIEVDAWRDKPEVQNFVREQLQQAIDCLAETHALDLGRLIGVTVTDRLDEALANFDDGGIQNKRTWVLKNSSFLPNGRKLGDRECLEN